MFTALEDTVALEIYWAELNHNDIHRDLIGGINERNDLTLFEDEEEFPTHIYAKKTKTSINQDMKMLFEIMLICFVLELARIILTDT